MKNIILSISLLLLSGVTFAQNPPRLNVPTLSPLSEVKQEVALTEVTLSYSRPSAKGRKIYGGLVPFGEVWRTGANASTKLTFTQDVKVGGNDLKAGTYALYTIPGESEWTIIIHKNTTLRALSGDVYKPENDAFRFMAKPDKTSGFVETFTIGFADLGSKSVNIEMTWENTSVKFPIEFDVDGQIDAQIAELSKAEGGMSDFNLFLAAEYYLNNDKDLNKAVEWIDAAIVKSPKNFRYGLLRAKIFNAKGDREGALKAIAEANAWAVEAKNANYIDQTRIFWESIKH